MTLRNIKEAEAALLPYVPLVKQLTGANTTLDRILPLMEYLGNPQDRLKMIHIAGTSGKTSTACFTAALLHAAGKNVGLTVSPHIDSVTERIQINGLSIDEQAFCEELGIFLDLIAEAQIVPSYFELLYAFSVWVLDRQGVEYAVIETGLGGLHDATNIATRADKVCIITDIGLDHQHILGDSLEEIAAQKIGIVHPGNHVFTYHQSFEVERVFNKWVNAQEGAMLTFVDEDVERAQYGEMPMEMPVYQQRNWLLACHVYRFLRTRDKLGDLSDESLRHTQRLQVPGRMQVLYKDEKIIVLDGAHNEQKMTAFIASFQQQYPGSRPCVLIAMKQDKTYETVVPLLTALSDHIIVTSFNDVQDLPVTSINAAHLARAFEKAGVRRVECVPDRYNALNRSLNAPESTVIVTGSLYLLRGIGDQLI